MPSALSMLFVTCIPLRTTKPFLRCISRQELLAAYVAYYVHSIVIRHWQYS